LLLVLAGLSEVELLASFRLNTRPEILSHADGFSYPGPFFD
jgi:hypothetical protein